MGTAIFTALAMAALSPSPAVTQEVGDRVRIRVGETTVVGDVTEIGQDSVDTSNRWMFVSTQFRPIAWSDIDLLERRSSHTLRGAGIGVALGVIAALWLGEEEPCPTCYDPELTTADAMYELLPGMGLIGAAIGSRVSRWETVELEREGQVTLAPVVTLRTGPRGSRGLAIGGCIRF